MQGLILFAQVLMLAGLGVVLFSVFNFFKKFSQLPQALPPEFIRWKRDAEDIILEVEKAGKEVIENIEDKIKILRKVERSAEEKIKELDRKIEQIAGISIKIPKGYEDNIDIVSTVQQPLEVPFTHQNRYARIYHLAEQGMDIAEIAREVNVGKGEVQLILDLKKEMGE